MVLFTPVRQAPVQDYIFVRADIPIVPPSIPYFTPSRKFFNSKNLEYLDEVTSIIRYKSISSPYQLPQCITDNKLVLSTTLLISRPVEYYDINTRIDKDLKPSAFIASVEGTQRFYNPHAGVYVSRAYEVSYAPRPAVGGHLVCPDIDELLMYRLFSYRTKEVTNPNYYYFAYTYNQLRILKFVIIWRPEFGFYQCIDLVFYETPIIVRLFPQDYFISLGYCDNISIGFFTSASTIKGVDIIFYSPPNIPMFFTPTIVGLLLYISSLGSTDFTIYTAILGARKCTIHKHGYINSFRVLDKIVTINHLFRINSSLNRYPQPVGQVQRNYANDEFFGKIFFENHCDTYNMHGFKFASNMSYIYQDTFTWLQNLVQSTGLYYNYLSVYGQQSYVTEQYYNDFISKIEEFPSSCKVFLFEYNVQPHPALSTNEYFTTKQNKFKLQSESSIQPVQLWVENDYGHILLNYYSDFIFPFELEENYSSIISNIDVSKGSATIRTKDMTWYFLMVTLTVQDEDVYKDIHLPEMYILRSGYRYDYILDFVGYGFKRYVNYNPFLYIIEKINLAVENEEVKEIGDFAYSNINLNFFTVPVKIDATLDITYSVTQGTITTININHISIRDIKKITYERKGRPSLPNDFGQRLQNYMNWLTLKIPGTKKKYQEHDVLKKDFSVTLEDVPLAYTEFGIKPRLPIKIDMTAGEVSSIDSSYIFTVVQGNIQLEIELKFNNEGAMLHKDPVIKIYKPYESVIEMVRKIKENRLTEKEKELIGESNLSDITIAYPLRWIIKRKSELWR